MSISIAEKISTLQPTLFEEDSYSFLIYYQQAKPWHVYDTSAFTLEFLLSYIDKFAFVDGRIPMLVKPSSDFSDDYWSSVPLGLFKFRLRADMTCALLNDYKNIPSYLVEGMYWNNGFFYFVKDDVQILQAKLFVDDDTKVRNGYPQL